MKRILHVIAGLHYGGTERYVVALMREAVRRGYRFDFLVWSREDDGYSREVESMGARIFRIPSRRNPLRHATALRDFMASHAGDYDAVHMSAGSLTNIAPLVYAAKAGIPLRLMHIHSVSCRGIHNRLLHHVNRRRIGRYAGALLACSEAAREWGYGGTPDYGRSLVVPNGIDVKEFRFDMESRRAVRAEYGFGDTYVFGIVGRISEEKNHRFLTEAFAGYRRSGGKGVLLVTGDGPGRVALEREAARLGLGEAIRFAGYRKDMGRIYSAVDALVMPSRFEGMPTVMLEARAAGLPILVSDRVPDDGLRGGYLRRLPLEREAWERVLAEVEGHARESVPAELEKRYGIPDCFEEIFRLYEGKYSSSNTYREALIDKR